MGFRGGQVLELHIALRPIARYVEFLSRRLLYEILGCLEAAIRLHHPDDRIDLYIADIPEVVELKGGCRPDGLIRSWKASSSRPGYSRLP